MGDDYTWLTGATVTPEAEYAVQSVLDMGRLLHQGYPGRQFLVPVLWAYSDESSSDEPSFIFAFAGYVAPAESWGVFAERWTSALRQHPGITRFHATDCFAGEQAFKDWSNEKCQQLVKELTEIINTTKDVRGFCSIIKRGEPESREGPFGHIATDPFVPAFGAVVHGLSKRASEISGRERIAFIFDRQRQWATKALVEYNLMKDAPDLAKSNRLGAAAFESSEEFIPLQAADLLSHQLRRYFFTQGREATTVENVRALCENRRVEVDVLDKRLVDEVYWPLGFAAFLRG
jgi:hypothetical protein